MSGDSHDLGPLMDVVEAERSRGNIVRLFTEERQLRGHPPYAMCHHPMDREAIAAEFELPPAYVWRPVSTGPWMLIDTESGRSVIDDNGHPGWRARRRRAAWWRAWRADPQSRRPLGEGQR